MTTPAGSGQNDTDSLVVSPVRELSDRLEVTAVRGAAWTAMSKWAIRFCSLATFALLARLIAPAEFGLIAMATAILEMLRMIAQQGFSQAIIRERDLDDKLVDTAFWLTMAGGTLTAGALVLAATAVEAVFGMPGLAPLLQVLSGYVVLMSLGAVPEALLSRALRFRELAMRTVFATMAGIVVALGMAFAGGGVWALVGQVLTQALVGTVLLWRRVLYRPRCTLGLKAARSTLRFGWIVLLIDLGTAVLGQADKVVIGAVLGETSLGYYALAFRLISTLDDTLVGVFSMLALPVFSRIQHDVEATLRALVRATRATLTTAAPVYLMVLVLAPVIVPLLFGAGWERSIPLLQVLCVAGLLACTMHFDRGVLLAAGRPGIELALVVIFAAGTVLAAYWGSAAGVLGAAIAVTARKYVTWPLRVIALRRVLPLRYGPFLGAWLPAAGAIALFVGAVLVARRLGDGAAQPVLLVIEAVVGLAVYVGFLLIVDRPFLTELNAAVRRSIVHPT